jgi:hypothetical protein
MTPEQEMPVLGVVASERAADQPLARAAAGHRTLRVRHITRDTPVSSDVAGLVVAAPLDERPTLLAHLARTWPVPLLVEAPVAATTEQAQPLINLADFDFDRIVAANPLRYGLHTARLVQQVGQRDDADPLHTIFAAWRFRSPAVPDHALPQLLDLLAALGPGAPSRISALERSEPAVLVATVRYASGVLGSLEVGCHLPDGFPSSSELIVECSCAERTYHCAPNAQAVSLYGPEHARAAWQPEPAEAMVRAFVDWLLGGPRPVGHVRADLAALADSQWLAQAARTGAVLTRDRT